MRKQVAIILLLVFTTVCSAQQVFDTDTFQKVMQGMSKDPVSFLKTQTTPDFTYLGSTPEDLAGTLAIYDRLRQLSRAYEQVKVRQYGTTGIATGILNHSYLIKATGDTTILKELFTYVFVGQKGSWKLASAQHRPFQAPLSEEEAAIKRVIEGETTAHYAANYNEQMSYWAKTPYVSILYGGGLFVGNELRKKYDEIYAVWKGQKVNITNSEWNIRVKNETAFVTFLLNRENLETKALTTSFQERYLEKMSGKWKIVSVTNIVKK